jgi:ParB family chromosome partitioning protein
MTDTTELTVLKQLAARRRVQWVATANKLYPAQVLDIAKRHGCLVANGEVDYTAAGYAAAELLQASAPAIAVREPASVKVPPIPRVDPGSFPHSQRPAPPVRVKPTPVTIAASRPAPAPPPTRAAGGDELLRVRIDQVHPDPDNPRTDIGDVTELAASLLSVGLLQPLIVRRTTSGSLLIVAGHRRHAAARLAGWTHVQVIVRRDMRPDDVLAAMLVENSHRKDLDAIEEARGLARLKGQLDLSDAALARRVGRHQAHVSARLMLLSLPIEEQEEIRRGEMSITEARDRARLASGRIGPGVGRSAIGHLAASHPLANRAKARCLQIAAVDPKHTRGKGKGVGGISCGECWEAVIRSDERQRLHAHSGRTGACAICDTPMATEPPTPLREATA